MFVATPPQTKGSTRSFVNKRTGWIMTTSDNPKLANFERAVHFTALEHGARPIEGALEVRLAFYLPRPKSHYWPDGSLKGEAPHYPIRKKRKDIDKLERATLDALTGACYEDDAQVVHVDKWKHWACGPDEKTGYPGGVGVRVHVCQVKE